MERIRCYISWEGDAMTVEEMKQRKKELGYSNEKLSELSGVPLGTVQKVLAGVTRSPRYETLIALERVLKKQTDRIDEALPETSEKRQGDYTVEDYNLLDMIAETVCDEFGDYHMEFEFEDGGYGEWDSALMSVFDKNGVEIWYNNFG